MVNGDKRGRATWMLLATIFLVSANMRGTITGVGSLLPDIASETGYDETVLGVLTAIPMLTWGIVSPFVSAVANRFGLNPTMGWALVGLLAATILRSLVLPGEAGLWVGTIIVGIALAVVNVLMPVATRRDFGPRASTVISINTNMLVVVAASASGFVVPLSEIPVGDGVLGWRLALMLTGVFAPFAIVFWFSTHRRDSHAPVAPTGATAVSHARRIWTDRIAWLLSWYMGLQAIQFFIISSWLVKMEVSRGVSQTEGGLEVMVMQLVGMVATIFLPLIRRAPSLDRLLPFVMVIPGVIAAAGMLFAWQLDWVWIIVLAVTSGPCLAIPLIQIGERAKDTVTATALSGMVNSFGYLVSGLGPILFGWLHTVSGGWAAPQWFYLAVMVALLVVGWFLCRPGFVLEPRGAAPAELSASGAGRSPR